MSRSSFFSFALVFALAIVAPGCGGGGGGGGGGAGPVEEVVAPLVLAAGMNQIDAVDAPAWADAVDTARLGVASVGAVYDLTTPRGEPFVFDVVSRLPGNRGPVRVSLAHAQDGGATPAGGVGTIANAGMVPSAAGTSGRPDWLDATGDGFARMTIRGVIDREQIVVVETSNDGTESGRGETAIVRIGIGPRSEINLAARVDTDYPGVVETVALYSSDSWRFGLPTVAVSGDRTSVVCYEGDLSDADDFRRYEMRLQHDRASGAITGGASEETSEDTGYWRDHEIAALFNVLALVHGGADAITLKLSFDRGATFAQTEKLSGATGSYRPRLAQIAMAADYSLGVAWWRSNANGSSDLVLVTGAPSALDGTGSPTAFTFDPPEVVHHVDGDVTPLIFDVAWSEGGDLVVAYGYTSFTSNPDGTWTSLTTNRCAVRPWADTTGTFVTDTLVEEARVVGRDPSVALTGSGASLRIFYAYEASDGVRMRTSEDGGTTFGAPIMLADPAARFPSVFAREQGGMTRVDLLYMTDGGDGAELHLRHWDDYDFGPFDDHRLTKAKMVESATVPRGRKVPGAPPEAFAPSSGYRITQVAPFGYDAALDGDDLVVVIDEETFDAWTICHGPPIVDFGRGPFEALDTAASPAFVPADPPPLAPGLTEPLPLPDAGHMHQLTLMRLD